MVVLSWAPSRTSSCSIDAVHFLHVGDLSQLLKVAVRIGWSFGLKEMRINFFTFCCKLESGQIEGNRARMQVWLVPVLNRDNLNKRKLFSIAKK